MKCVRSTKKFINHAPIIEVSKISKNHNIDEDDYVLFNDVSARTDRGRVENVYHNSHSYVLVFKLDLVHDKCIVTLPTINPKTRKDKNIAITVA